MPKGVNAILSKALSEQGISGRVPRKGGRTDGWHSQQLEPLFRIKGEFINKGRDAPSFAWVQAALKGRGEWSVKFQE